MAAIQTTDADGWPVIFVLALREEMRCRAIRHIDALLERLDAITAQHVEAIRAAGSKLGIDPRRVEADVDAFERRHELERSWYLRQRAAAVLGLDLLIEPPQA